MPVMQKVSERANPARYQAALIRAALRAGLADDVSEAALDQAATEAGLRPAKYASTRDAVRYAIENPVSFADDCNQDIAFAVFDAAETGRSLVVVDARGERSVMTPEPVEDPT
ncbi:hypothetical protein [Streptomyces nanshensis]|uniref:Uncharacterized protein n=1 Tax=Streptomyces nanshensis TaxID=518642 RepID=A0A1E7L544_9ACTN|nr:hypothetical protein [Streptomyces nanshensis]OEV11326.1 hypothetical protein AN218_13315 [Streptomyces nanshensis]